MMLPCIAIGDGTAIGVAEARPGCVAIGAAGLSARAFVAGYLGRLKPARTAIISLGAFDAAGSDLAGELRRIRRAVHASKVIWLVPDARPASRLAVGTVAAEWNDSIIDTRSGGGTDAAPTPLEARAAQTKKLSPPIAPRRDSNNSLLACGPTVAPTTLQAIIRVESGGDAYAINVNGAAVQPTPANSAAEATATALAWIARGYSVDLGLMQVNSRNLPGLGYSVAQMFDPCTNIAAGAAVLTADYLTSLSGTPDPQAALRAALSAYNTGSFERGFYNGYVAKYYRADAGRPVPIITAAAMTSRSPEVAHPLNPFTASMVVYSREDTHE